MKRGHVTGHKKERTGKGWWYQTEEVEALNSQRSSSKGEPARCW